MVLLGKTERKNVEIKELPGLQSVSLVIKMGRQWWFGHFELMLKIEIVQRRPGGTVTQKVLACLERMQA